MTHMKTCTYSKVFFLVTFCVFEFEFLWQNVSTFCNAKDKISKSHLGNKLVWGGYQNFLQALFGYQLKYTYVKPMDVRFPKTHPYFIL
jgi:hypothetical protein